jgi:hypothetical protein
VKSVVPIGSDPSNFLPGTNDGTFAANGTTYYVYTFAEVQLQTDGTYDLKPGGRINSGANPAVAIAESILAVGAIVLACAAGGTGGVAWTLLPLPGIVPSGTGTPFDQPDQIDDGQVPALNSNGNLVPTQMTVTNYPQNGAPAVQMQLTPSGAISPQNPLIQMQIAMDSDGNSVLAQAQLNNLADRLGFAQSTVIDSATGSPSSVVQQYTFANPDDPEETIVGTVTYTAIPGGLIQVAYSSAFQLYQQAASGALSPIGGGGGGSVPWSSVTGTPTTLSGYGVSSVPWSTVAGEPTSAAGYGIANGASLDSLAAANATGSLYYLSAANTWAALSLVGAAISGGTLTIGVGPAPTTAPSLTASASSGQVALSWTTATGAAAYVVYRSLSSTMSSPTTVYNGSGTSYTDTSVTNGMVYYYQAFGFYNGAYGPGSTVQSAGPTNDGPKLLWRFDDGSGTSAADSSGNGNVGTLVNSPTWSSTIPTVHVPDTNSLLFSAGSSNYVDCTAFDTGDSVGSVSIWYKLTSTSTASFLWCFSNNSVLTTFFGIEFRGDNFGELQVYVLNGGSGLNMNTTSGVSNTTWHNLILTSNGSTVSLYLDGALQTMTVGAGSNSGQWLSALSGVNIFSVGGIIRSSSNVYCSAYIDEVRYYNYCLSSTQIAYLASGYNQDGNPT